jgi:hypothetical protein
MTVGDLLTRYRDEVTPTKRGAFRETVALNLFLRHRLSKLDTSKNPLGARIWGAGCVNDGREHGIWASMVRFAG